MPTSCTSSLGVRHGKRCSGHAEKLVLKLSGTSPGRYCPPYQVPRYSAQGPFTAISRAKAGCRQSFRREAFTAWQLQGRRKKAVCASASRVRA